MGCRMLSNFHNGIVGRLPNNKNTRPSLLARKAFNHSSDLSTNDSPFVGLLKMEPSLPRAWVSEKANIVR